MDTLREVWIELYRMQVLPHIRGVAGPTAGGLSAWDLARWLRVEIDECTQLMDELAEDGLVAPLPAGPRCRVAPLSLSDAGRGCLAWLALHPR